MAKPMDIPQSSTVVNLPFIKSGLQFQGVDQSSYKEEKLVSTNRRLTDFYDATAQAAAKAVADGYSPIMMRKNSLRNKQEPETSSLSSPPITVLNVDFLRSGQEFTPPSPENTAMANAMNNHALASHHQHLEEFYEKTQAAVTKAAAEGYAPK